MEALGLKRLFKISSVLESKHRYNAPGELSVLGSHQNRVAGFPRLTRFARSLPP